MRTLRALAAALLVGASLPAGAATLQIKDGNGTLQTFDFFQDGSGNYFGTLGIWGLLGDYQADVNSSHQLLVTGPVTNAGTFAVQAAQSGTWTVTGAGGTFPVTGTFWQATQPVSGTVTANAGTNLNTSALATDAHLTALGTSALGTDAHLTAFTFANHTDLSAINTTLGSPMQASGGTVTVTQPTAANLNMTCANCSGSGVSATDNSTGFTAGTSPLTPTGGQYSSSLRTAITSGKQAMASLTQYGSLWFDWYNSSGNEMGTASYPVQVSLANTATNSTGVVVTGASAAALATDAHLTALGTSALATDAHLTALGTGALGTDAHLTAFTFANHTDLTAINSTLATLNSTAGAPLATQAISNIVGGVGLNATPSLANGNGVVPTVGGSAVSTSNPLPAVQAVNVTPTDCSVTLTTGGTAQNAFAAQTALHGFTIANIDAGAGSGEPVWFSLTGTASAGAAGSYPLSAPTATTLAGLASFTAPPGFGTGHALSVVAATTGHKISCTWW